MICNYNHLVHFETGEITPTDKIRRGENGRWVEAAKVAGLFDDTARPENIAAVSEPRARPLARPATLVVQSEPPPARGPEVPVALPVKPSDNEESSIALVVSQTALKTTKAIGGGLVRMGAVALEWNKARRGQSAMFLSFRASSSTRFAPSRRG